MSESKEKQEKESDTVIEVHHGRDKNDSEEEKTYCSASMNLLTNNDNKMAEERQKSFVISSFNADSRVFHKQFEITGSVHMAYISADIVVFQEMYNILHADGLLAHDAFENYSTVHQSPNKLGSKGTSKELLVFAFQKSFLKIISVENVVPKVCASQWFRMPHFICVSDALEENFFVVNVHMGRNNNSVEDFGHLADCVKSLETDKFLIIGDFNKGKRDEMIQELCASIEGSIEEPDFPTTLDSGKQYALDYVIHGKGIVVKNCSQNPIADFDYETVKVEMNHLPIQFEVKLNIAE